VSGITSTLVVEANGPVLHVRLNRPAVRNAFNEELIAELTSWAQGIDAGAGARAAVLEGAG